MVQHTFRARGDTGDVAIIEGLDRDGPFFQPLSHLPNLKFHSAFGYRKILSSWSGTVYLPAIVSELRHTGSYHLFNHGRPGKPSIQVATKAADGGDVMLTGHVPVQKGYIIKSGAEGPGGVMGRWISVGADATSVYLFEFATAFGNTSEQSQFRPTYWERYDGMTLPLTVFVRDKILP